MVLIELHLGGARWDSYQFDVVDADMIVIKSNSQYLGTWIKKQMNKGSEWE